MAERNEHQEQVIDQFTSQAESYARLVDTMRTAQAGAQSGAQAGRRPDLVALLQATADDVALDVACGSGAIALDLARTVSHVTGVDLTPAMLDQARAAQAAKGIANVDWRLSDGYHLPFDDGAFTIITCSAAFHHLERPGAALAEMVRVCRPGGRIAVMDLTPAPDKVAAFDAMERKRDPSHVHALTPDELRSLADGLDLNEAAVVEYVTGNVPIDAVLATSFPVEYSVAELRAMFLEDALSGEDRLGFSAALSGEMLLVSYPMSVRVWTRPLSGSDSC